MKKRMLVSNEKGHKVLADPRVHRHSVRLNSEENEKFLTMFEQSGMKYGAQYKMWHE